MKSRYHLVSGNDLATSARKLINTNVHNSLAFPAQAGGAAKWWKIPTFRSRGSTSDRTFSTSMVLKRAKTPDYFRHDFCDTLLRGNDETVMNRGLKAFATCILSGNGADIRPGATSQSPTLPACAALSDEVC